MGKLYQVIVYGLRGENMMIDLCNTEEQFKNMTVLQLKEKIREELPENAGKDAFKLIFQDKLLDGNDCLLSAYGIQHLSVIHMVVKVPGGGGPDPRWEDGGMGDKGGKNRISSTQETTPCLPLVRGQRSAGEVKSEKPPLPEPAAAESSPQG